MKLEEQENTREAVLLGAAVLFVLSAVLMLLRGVYLIKKIRCMNAVQRALPTIKAASKRYLDQNPDVWTEDDE